MKVPKMKTNRGAAKRFRKTATGKIKRYKLRETAAEETPLHK